MWIQSKGLRNFCLVLDISVRHGTPRNDSNLGEDLLVFESNVVRCGDSIHMTVSESIRMESKEVGSSTESPRVRNQ